MPSVPFLEILRSAKRTGTADTAPIEDQDEEPKRRILIVGNPNVGKSVVFNRLTGRYVVVSNYPGTTVEVSRGKARVGDMLYEVVDTPGMYSLRPISDEERVGRALLLDEQADVVLHVVDAKNLERMLPFTLQLVEAGFPTVLAVNMLDEAERVGLQIDTEQLAAALGIPVVGTVAPTGRGVDRLRNVIDEFARAG